MDRRLLLSLPLAAVMALAGCNTRSSKGVAADEQSAENARLTGLVNSLSDENAELRARLAAANAGAGAGNVGDDIARITGGDIEGFEATDKGGLALPDDFAFAKGSAELNEAGQAAVKRLAERLGQGDNAGKLVVVEGHTDDSPVARASTKEKFGDNWGLSAMRARSVLSALESAGVASSRLKGQFRGMTAPRATGSTPEEKARNRRVEIYLLK